MTRLLDITRLIRRAGRPMTGIDRVEYAYLRTLSARDEPLFCLARTRLGYVLLDKSGARDIARRLADNDFGPMDLLGKLSRRGEPIVRQAEADLRRGAIDRAVPPRLEAMLARHLPVDTRYINVGHSNLTPRVIRALKRVGSKIAVLVHDVIPLEAPEVQREETVARFADFIRRVDQNADLIIYNSEDTRLRTARFLQGDKTSVVAHLGVEIAQKDLLPETLDVKAPYFVTLGTIEPRKNHALLLDIWSTWGETAPQLVIVGGRGWRNDAVFKRLDEGHSRIIEAPNLSDGAVSTLLSGARALLFPSNLEGFGLPPMEAATLNVPVICQPLPVLREVMGDIPIYLEGSDPYPWRKEIESLAEQRRTPKVFVPPSWTDHFNTVLTLT